MAKHSADNYNRQLADYISELTLQLSHMAGNARFKHLQMLCEMASLEAHQLARRSAAQLPLEIEHLN